MNPFAVATDRSHSNGSQMNPQRLRRPLRVRTRIGMTTVTPSGPSTQSVDLRFLGETCAQWWRLTVGCRRGAVTQRLTPWFWTKRRVKPSCVGRRSWLATLACAVQLWMNCSWPTCVTLVGTHNNISPSCRSQIPRSMSGRRAKLTGRCSLKHAFHCLAMCVLFTVNIVIDLVMNFC